MIIGNILSNILGAIPNLLAYLTNNKQIETDARQRSAAWAIVLFVFIVVSCGVMSVSSTAKVNFVDCVMKLCSITGTDLEAIDGN